MTEKLKPSEIRMIPIGRIDVLNPRERNKVVFDEIVGNIKSIGLKKPITVTTRPGPDGTERYLLVCGEGRMKAFQSLGDRNAKVVPQSLCLRQSSSKLLLGRHV